MFGSCDKPPMYETNRALIVNEPPKCESLVTVAMPNETALAGARDLSECVSR